jgi:hypothetical protein
MLFARRRMRGAVSVGRCRTRTSKCQRPRRRQPRRRLPALARAAEHFENRQFQVTQEHRIDGNGAIDLLAERPGERIAIEVETGKSDIAENLRKVQAAGFDKVVLIATSPSAISACQQAIDAAKAEAKVPIELLSWLDL